MNASKFTLIAALCIFAATLLVECAPIVENNKRNKVMYRRYRRRRPSAYPNDLYVDEFMEVFHVKSKPPMYRLTDDDVDRIIRCDFEPTLKECELLNSAMPDFPLPTTNRTPSTHQNKPTRVPAVRPQYQPRIDFSTTPATTTRTTSPTHWPIYWPKTDTTSRTPAAPKTTSTTPATTTTTTRSWPIFWPQVVVTTTRATPTTTTEHTTTTTDLPFFPEITTLRTSTTTTEDYPLLPLIPEEVTDLEADKEDDTNDNDYYTNLDEKYSNNDNDYDNNNDNDNNNDHEDYDNENDDENDDNDNENYEDFR